MLMVCEESHRLGLFTATMRSREGFLLLHTKSGQTASRTLQSTDAGEPERLHSQNGAARPGSQSSIAQVEGLGSPQN